MELDRLRPQLIHYVDYLLDSFQTKAGNPTVDFTGGKLVAAILLSHCHVNATLQGSESSDLNQLIRDIRDVLLLFKDDRIEWTITELGTLEPRLTSEQSTEMNQWTVYQIDSVLSSIYTTLRKYCEPYPARPRPENELPDLG